MNSDPPDSVLRITREEANSQHVDDLLRRQMSLRGEAGVARDRRRGWYYQNWLVFGVVGLLGAVLAWAVLEPFFEDMPYLQGAISEIDLLADPPRVRGSSNAPPALTDHLLGSITIENHRVFLARATREILPDGKVRKLDPLTLETGETAGTYVEVVPGTDDEFIVSGLVRRNPPPLSSAEAKLTLDQRRARSQASSLLLFPLVAGCIGLFIGAADGAVCRLARRAFLGGSVGLLVGIVGGFLSLMLAGIVYTPLSNLASSQMPEPFSALSTFGFAIQMVARSLAWCVAGMAMGLGQGIALRSRRLLLYGWIGGLVGGLIGGLLFDPIDLLLLGPYKPSAHWSRLIGLAVIGAAAGGMIGVVELLARDAWLRMTQGPLAGKEFLLFKDRMALGASPRSDIYLFSDPGVAPDHALIRAVGDESEIEAVQTAAPVLVNHRPVTRARLRHGDNVTIGRTVFVFQQRKA